MNSYRKPLLALLAAASWAGAPAQATPITGEIWENFTASTLGDEGGSLANVATLQGIRAADVTFSVAAPINFHSDVGGYSIGGFLGSGGATVLTGAGEMGNSLDNTLFYFSGMVAMVNGQSYNIDHDDGVELAINGSDVINANAATNTFFTWTGASGNYNCELAYAEVEGPPGTLDTDLPFQGVPDSGNTMAMLGGALTVMGAVARRFRK
jgi:hypothetical protein